MQNEKQISKLADYIDYINIVAQKLPLSLNTHFLFRGQSQDWELLPKIARANNEGYLQFDEKAMFDCFQREAIRFLDTRPDNVWDWLAVAQHHGLPTRLLDWSKNPLVALWFTVECVNREFDSHGVVWIYQPDHSDLITDKRTAGDPFDGHHTKVYAPQHLIPRIHSQDAVFTVHKCLKNSNRFIAMQKDEREINKLAKIIIPAEHFQSICNQLEKLGVHSASLFADLDGLTRHIKKQHILST
jgi:hypothetical protein